MIPKVMVVDVNDSDITEEEHEVTPHEERLVGQQETVPVERVRMNTQTVTLDEQVSTDLRREQIETDDGANYESKDRPGADRHGRRNQKG
jgi:hypothetical protein